MLRQSEGDQVRGREKESECVCERAKERARNNDIIKERILVNMSVEKETERVSRYRKYLTHFFLCINDLRSRAYTNKTSNVLYKNIRETFCDPQ